MSKVEIEFISIKTKKPDHLRLCLFEVLMPSGEIDFYTGWRSKYREDYEYQCNMEDTHHGGYLEVPGDVIGYIYLQ